MKDLLVFGLAHIGAFVVFRDILESSGVDVIADSNGIGTEYEAEDAEGNIVSLPDPAIYIVPEAQVSQSEVWNYMLLGDKMAKYVFKPEHMLELYNKATSYANKVIAFAGMVSGLPFKAFFANKEEAEAEVTLDGGMLNRSELYGEPESETFIGFNRVVTEDDGPVA